MQDNVLVGPTNAVDVTTHNSLSNPALLAHAIEQYDANRSGILTNVGGDVAGRSTFLQSMHQLDHCAGALRMPDI